MTVIMNPCKGICKIHPTYNLCQGCYRTILEIKEWPTCQDSYKESIIEECKLREEVLGVILNA